MPADRHLSNVGESGVTQNTTSVYDLSGTAKNATYQTFGDSTAADAEDIWVRLNSEDSDKYEVGLFTFNTGTPNTLTRVSTVESSNADSAVDFGTESIEAVATVIPGQKATSSDLADFEEAPNIATGIAEAPLTLGANNQGQLVTGLNADQVDGNDASALGGSQLGAKIYEADDQSIGQFATINVPFDTTVFDNGGFVDLANNRLTIPTGEGGLYLLAANLWAVDAAGFRGDFYADIDVNGSPVARGGSGIPDGQGGGANPAVVADLAAGDHITVDANSNQGVDVQGGEHTLNLSCTKVIG